MKKTLLVAVVLCLAFTAKVFAEEAKKAPEAKPVTTATATVKTEAPKPAESVLKGNITKLEGTNISVKDNAGKEWTFNVGITNVKEYKVGDSVEVKYEKDNLKTIAKVLK